MLLASLGLTIRFNPWIGCTKVSAGCAHCYAERENGKFQWNRDGWGKGVPRKRASRDYWKKPFTWQTKAAAMGVRSKVFCASLADILDEEVEQSWRDDVWAIIERTPNLDWLLLTKRLRPLGVDIRFPVPWTVEKFPDNVWLMASVEDQATANDRVPTLLTYRNVVKVLGLSVEPLIGRVSLSGWLGVGGLDWVIVGGESGPDHRSMNLYWALDLLEDCERTKTPFFFKQVGGWPDRGESPESIPAWLLVREFPK